MASPIPPAKKSVDLSEPAPRVSRIRRDPPPKAKPVTAVEIKERDARTVAIGLTLMALALFVALIGLTNAAGWSPSQYTWRIKAND